MNSDVLILGRNGQVGRHLVQQLPTATAWGRDDLNLTESSSIGPKLKSLRPSWVINASAYTAVDQAESEEDLALQVNGYAVGEIAKICAEIDARLVHFSTDYVFDGSKAGAYVSSDPTNPINAYGRSKLEGERQIALHCEAYWIVRTSWVFSEHAPNFLKTMVRIGRERELLQVVGDQFGKPTYAGELARIVRSLVSGELDLSPGVHHAGCPDATTWYDFATEIFSKVSSLQPGYRVPELVSVASSSYEAAAKRPNNSVLSVGDELGMQPWRDFIAQCLP